MSCCNSTPCTCGTCPEQSAFASPLTQVSKGSSLLVSDRNGNAKILANKDFSIPNSFEGGNVKYRSGSSDDPINLKFLQSILDGTAVLVKNGQGHIGVVIPSADDTFLAYVGGRMQFVSTIPRANLFNSDEVIAQSGKLATFGCETNGQTSIGFLTGSGDYLTVIDGAPYPKNFCDAETSDELDYLFGCSDGSLKKIAPAEGMIVVEEGGKWVVRESVTEEQWVGGADIWSKTYSVINDTNFADTTVAFGSSVPTTAKWVQIRITNYYVISTQYGTGTIYINGVPIIKTRAQGSFASHQGDACLYVPYGTGSFIIRGQHVASNSGSNTAVGQLAVGVLSYK